MILIACVDDHWGMMFNRRRQSQDRLVRRDILEGLGQGSTLWMNQYTFGHFLQTPHPRIAVAEDFLRQANPGDFCLAEAIPPDLPRERLEGVILYRWDRAYPADQYFDPALLEGFSLKSTLVFPGHSHPNITKDCFTR